MSNIKIREDDYGEVLEVLAIDTYGNLVDLSGVTVSTFTFQKPDGTLINKTGTVIPSGIYYVASYIIEAGFFNMAGHWKYSVTFASPSAFEYHTDINSITVKGNLS